MKTYRIKNLAGEVIFEGSNLEGANLRGAKLEGSNLRWANLEGAKLEGADLFRANLIGTNLQGADLQGAYLQGANLRYATGNGLEIKNLEDPTYHITYTKDVLAIGCQQHSKQEWIDFRDTRIATMDAEALEWWKVWKPKLLELGVL